MKVAVVVLMVLGILAAGSAMMLFEWIQAKSARAASDSTTAHVLIAQADLPARTLLTGAQVKAERVPKAGLPQGYFTDPAQAIGKTLKMAVIKGQALSSSCCIAKGSIDDLLRPGMLAVPIQLSRRSASPDLLYPGCIVDVFATFPLRDRTKGEAVVTPLLQNIQVLGIADETVLSESSKQDGIVPRKKTYDGNVTVTLEVTARQAAALQLAMEQGSLSLPMRNPLDKDLNPMEPMVVKEGQLAAASESMDPQTLALVNRLQQMLGNGTTPASAENTSFAGAPPASAGSDPNVGAPAAPVTPAVPEYLDPPKSRQMAWQMTIIRGQKVEETEIQMREGQDEQPAAEGMDN